MRGFSLVLTVCTALVAIIYLYDAKRALWPRIPNERPWRWRRVAGTSTALMTIYILQRPVGPLWLKRVALLILVLALGAVLRCSVQLKRMVATVLRQRREAWAAPPQEEETFGERA